MFSGSLFVFKKTPRKFSCGNFNCIFENLIGGITEIYCVVEYPLGFVSVFTEFSAKIPVVTL